MTADRNSLATMILGTMLRSDAPPNSGQLALDIADAIITGKMPPLNESAFKQALADILRALEAGSAKPELL